MSVLVIGDERFHEHVPLRGHPERAARLDAVAAGISRVLDADALERRLPRMATDTELAVVHEVAALERLRTLDTAGGGQIDGDTMMSPGSWTAARLAAGAGLVAIESLDAGHGDQAFCAVRPPGHHATARESMGFCLVNNVAVTAASLVARGDRVAILDIDAHHGNGTQDIFLEEPGVLFVSFHQWPAYPGTGAAQERGTGPGFGTTVNIPLPPGATGDIYLRGFDEIVAPALDAFDADWTLISAGFDSHRRDPLTDLGLTSADHGALMARCLEHAESGRTILFLEGGYDLSALTLSIASTFEALLGISSTSPEPMTSGGPGQPSIDRRLRLVHE